MPISMVTKWRFTCHCQKKPKQKRVFSCYAAEHILNPKDGKPVVTPSQDMVLGNYYITMEESGREVKV
jgi:hypothetical protein